MGEHRPSVWLRFPACPAVIVFEQARTLLATWARTRAKCKRDYLSPLKMILFCAVFATVLSNCCAQGKSGQKHAARQPNTISGKETFLKYCASCHGADAKGNGPAAIALKPPPSDLTALTKRYDGKFPTGYVGALVKFGRSLAAHGSEDMPVWGSRFKTLDPVHDPTGQQHVDDLVAYIESLQVK